MATRSCREKAQKLNEQHQLILSKLLREEDNKYCADCEAKGSAARPSGRGSGVPCSRRAGAGRMALEPRSSYYWADTPKTPESLQTTSRGPQRPGCLVHPHDKCYFIAHVICI